MTSPDRTLLIKPRVLTYGMSPENDSERTSQTNIALQQAKIAESPKKQPTCSPPYRRVRALRLFDTPSTPKTIIQKSTIARHLKLDNTNLTTPGENGAACRIDRPTAVHVHNKSLYPTANVNPFTPDSLSMRNKKRSRTTFLRESAGINYTMPDISNNNKDPTDKNRRTVASLFSNYVDPSSTMSMSCMSDDISEVNQAPKRLALQDSNITRYEKEFVELASIGFGQFGLVYKCLNRLDGCVYAIKKSIKPVAGSVFEKTALNEVWAHAVLGKHDNVVRYYSAWAENNHMLIQNEYCNGGSLQTLIQQRFLCESELRILLCHIAAGLKYIHSNDLVHMDLKAGNIFMNKILTRPTSNDSGDDGFDSEEDPSSEYIVTYKIGDLGHVTSINDPQVEEGDCRYLPNEILQQDFSQLCKADIFSLGITLYEAGGGGPLPKNGTEWHTLRNGNVPDLPGLSRKFNDLIKLMTHPNPNKRPSSSTIFHHPIFSTTEKKSKAQIAHELQMERQKNEVLMKKLKQTTALLKSYEMAKTPNNKKASSSSSNSLNAVQLASDRRLRSFTKKRLPQRSSLEMRRRTSHRDQNKNVVGELGYFR